MVILYIILSVKIFKYSRSNKYHSNNQTDALKCKNNIEPKQKQVAETITDNYIAAHFDQELAELKIELCHQWGQPKTTFVERDSSSI